MSTLDTIFSELRALFVLGYRVQEIVDNTHSLPNEVIDSHKQRTYELENIIKEKLKYFLLFPPHHSRHLSKLGDFHKAATYKESVFIMTKFPEGNDTDDVQLKRIIEVVSKSIKDCGFCPRLASDVEYHSLLWDNIELYLLGCCKGVAIVEDHYKPELNPNVSMEWGWMRGMGKEVLFLVENNFQQNRADLSGLLKHNFSWENPEGDIEQAIKSWLKEEVADHHLNL
jgi:hypothetical protein